MKRRSRGFSLIELIVALTISVVAVGFVATFIAVPVRVHTAQARRAELASAADTMTRAMAEDVRTALPGSPRTYVDNGRVVLELIPVLGVVRYCDAVGAICTDELDFAASDTEFDVLDDPQGIAADFVAVTDNDPTVSTHEAYSLTSVIAAAQDTTVRRIRLDAPSIFVESSPNNRAFLVSAVTRYECDTNAGTLRRYASIPLPAAAGPPPAGASSDVIARDVTACRFTWVPAPPPPQRPQNGGVVVVEITISRVTDAAPENLRVVKQLRLEHAA
jgi:MSHA biogenesis protein MshO